MNETTSDHRLDLGQYVAEVRRSLADLPSDARDELTDGLAADLSELVDEQGPGALPRPDEYAAELRAAAGLPPAPRWSWPTGDWWRPAWDIVVTAQPVWWVARAWVWVMLLHVATWGQAPGPYDVPWLPTSSWGVGMALWVAASVVSIQIGRGRIWPGGQRGTAAAFILLVVNVATLGSSLIVWDQVDRVLNHRAESYDGNDTNPDVITYQDQQSCNLLVFGADGAQLTGVRIEDQSGRVLPQRNDFC